LKKIGELEQQLEDLNRAKLKDEVLCGVRYGFVLGRKTANFGNY
jgi:hypothetical protein